MGSGRKLLTAVCTFTALAPTAPAQDDYFPDETLVVSDLGIDRLAVGGQIRGRAEYRSPRTPMMFANSDSTNTLRARVHVDAQIDEMVRGFFEFQAAVVPDAGAMDTNVLR